MITYANPHSPVGKIIITVLDRKLVQVLNVHTLSALGSVVPTRGVLRGDRARPTGLIRKTRERIQNYIGRYLGADNRYETIPCMRGVTFQPTC